MQYDRKCNLKSFKMFRRNTRSTKENQPLVEVEEEVKLKTQLVKISTKIEKNENKSLRKDKEVLPSGNCANLETENYPWFEVRDKSDWMGSTSI